MKISNSFVSQDLAAFEAEAKVALLATVNARGLPHLTLITSLQAKDTKRLIFGQFTEGLSKKHVANCPQTGFLIMTLDRKLWRGKTRWTHSVQEGEDYEMYNRKPMFRYNAYLNIHTVHYMDLITTSNGKKLPLAPMALSVLLARLAKGRRDVTNNNPVMKEWSIKLFNNLASFKFISYVGNDGYPVIIPVFSCSAASDRRLTFSPLAYRKEVALLSAGTPVAVFALSLDMTSVLVRGIFQGFQKKSFIRSGNIDIDWVYNAMPPVPGQIYPAISLNPVTVFD